MSLLLNACVTDQAAMKSAAVARSQEMLAQAEGALAGGAREKALSLLDQAGKEDPTAKEPWMKMANIHFAAGNYPAAVLAANEAVQRDPEDQDAKGILVVAGLRIAAQGVVGLRSKSLVNADSRAQAEQLTQSLRNILGEAVLVPPPDEAEKVPEAKARVAPRSRPAPVARRPAATTSAPSGNGDPFRSLK